MTSLFMAPVMCDCICYFVIANAIYINGHYTLQVRESYYVLWKKSTHSLQFFTKITTSLFASSSVSENYVLQLYCVQNLSIQLFPMQFHTDKQCKHIKEYQ